MFLCTNGRQHTGMHVKRKLVTQLARCNLVDKRTHLAVLAAAVSSPSVRLSERKLMSMRRAAACRSYLKDSKYRCVGNLNYSE